MEVDVSECVLYQVAPLASINQAYFNGWENSASLGGEKVKLLSVYLLNREIQIYTERIKFKDHLIHRIPYKYLQFHICYTINSSNKS